MSKIVSVFKLMFWVWIRVWILNTSAFCFIATIGSSISYSLPLIVSECSKSKGQLYEIEISRVKNFYNELESVGQRSQQHVKEFRHQNNDIQVSVCSVLCDTEVLVRYCKFVSFFPVLCIRIRRDPDPHESGIFAWIRIWNYSSGSGSS